jgi:hypothetical protein
MVAGCADFGGVRPCGYELGLLSAPAVNSVRWLTVSSEV